MLEHCYALAKKRKKERKVQTYKDRLVNLHPVVKKNCTHVEMWGPCGPRLQLELNVIVSYRTGHNLRF